MQTAISMDEILIVLCFQEDPPIHRYVQPMCTCTHAHVPLFPSVCLRCMYSQQTRDVDSMMIWLGRNQRQRAVIKPASSRRLVFTGLYRPAMQILTLKL